MHVIHGRWHKMLASFDNTSDWKGMLEKGREVKVTELDFLLNSQYVLHYY
jgi:hypothetical protein